MIHPRHWRAWLRSRQYEFWMGVGARELRTSSRTLPLHIRSTFAFSGSGSGSGDEGNPLQYRGFLRGR